MLFLPILPMASHYQSIAFYSSPRHFQVANPHGGSVDQFDIPSSNGKQWADCPRGPGFAPVLRYTPCLYAKPHSTRRPLAASTRSRTCSFCMKCIMQRFPVFIAENGSLRFSLLLMPPHATARAIHPLPCVSPFFPRVD